LPKLQLTRPPLPTADVLADLALILLPLRLIRGIKEKRLRRRLIFIFSTSSSSLFSPPYNRAHSFVLPVVTTIVSLVHASYIITRGGIPVIISALVEDCMSLTVANLPVVVTAGIIHFSGASSRDNDPDGDGQRWSSWKFHTRTQHLSTATNTTQLTSNFRPRGGGGGRAVAVNTTATTNSDGTDTTIDVMKKGAIPAYEVGSEEQLFGAPGAEKTEGEVAMAGNDQATTVATAVRREDRGVVRIDALPYRLEPPSPATGEP
jgi:hypothetical protein